MKEINKELTLLFYHIKSFMDNNGGLHSLNITYWEQEFESPVNIMNAYPYICGIVELLKKSENHKLKSTLHMLIEFILASQREDGFFVHSYGDISKTPAPPIIQIATDIALLRYYGSTNDNRVIEAIIKNLKFIEAKFLENSILSNRVVNQNSYLLKFLLILNDYYNTSEINMDEIKNFILRNQHGNGGFFHGEHLSDELSFYNAKVGLGLLPYVKSRTDEKVMNSLFRLYDFLNGLYDRSYHLFYAGMFAKENFFNKINKHLYKKEHYYKSYKKRNFYIQQKPMFIARAANTFRFMYLFSRSFKKDDKGFWEKEIVHFTHTYVRNNGSFPNSYGLGNEGWKNISSVVRWESYVFYLLSFFGEFNEIENYNCEIKIEQNDLIYEENDKEIIYKDSKYDLGALKWQKL